MFKKLITILTAVMLTLSASSTFAAFADLELIRVYYDRAGAEIATDLGVVNTLLTSPTNKTGSFGSLTAGYAVYFALNRATNNLWVSGSTTAASVINGTSTGLTGLKSGTTPMYTLFKTQGGTDYTGLASATNSYKNKISSTQGTMAGAITAATGPRTEASLASLISTGTGSVSQSLWYWPNGNATATIDKLGVAVATIVTNADGSTDITPITPIVNGACGSAADQPLVAVPTTNLCTSGTPLVVTGTGPWGWVCNGRGIESGVAGTNAGCATLITIEGKVVGGNGTITCDSPVVLGGSSVCTITPSNAYQLTTLTDTSAADNSPVDVTTSVAGNSYTISNVIANHTIVATFTANTGTPTTPTITWGPLANIAYGTALSSTQLNATASDPGTAASVPGNFVYTTALGDIVSVNDVLPADTYSLTATFTPSDTATYNTGTAKNSLTVNPTTPNVTTWPTASPITYGQTLASSKLTGGSATSGVTPVPGTFAFTTPATTPIAGTANQDVTFTPTDTTNYNLVTGTVSVLVYPATLTVIAAPQSKTYGAADQAFNYSATGFVNQDTSTVMTGSLTRVAGENVGSYAINQGSLSAGANYTISYTGANLTITKADAVIIWPTAASAITYGQTLALSNLSGWSSTPTGTFAFTTPATTPNAGTANQGVTFTPNDATNYNSATGTVSVTVNKADAVITWPTAASAITYVQTLASSNLSGGSSTPAGTFAFSAPITAPNAGTANQSVTFTPNDAANYNSATNTVSVTVNKADAVITWPTTASAITYGQTLALSNLSGGSSTPAGTFAFSAPATAPNAGSASQGVSFTPNDAANYNSAANGSVSVTVSRAILTVKADAKSRMYNTVNPPLTYTISGYVNNENSSVLSGAPVLSTLADTSSVVGDYWISVTTGTLAASNYAFAPVNALLTVTPISLAQNPILILGNLTYADLTAAIPGITADSTILVRDTYTPAAPETLLFDKAFTINLNGGMNVDGNPTAGRSILQGTLKIKAGKLIVSGIAIR